MSRKNLKTIIPNQITSQEKKSPLRIASALIRGAVEPINRLLTQEMQDKYITKSFPFPVNSRHIESPHYFVCGRIPLVMETFRALGLPQSIQRHLPLLQRQGKYPEADYIESLISIFAAGGDSADDFEMLRRDEGLTYKLGLY